MIQIIVNAFVEKDKTGAAVLFAIAITKKWKPSDEELAAQYPENYLAIYDLPLDTDWIPGPSICAYWEKRV